MRVATFNLLHGRSLSDGAVDPARLAEAVRAIDADVLALQEVDRGQPRSGGHDLTQVTAEAMGAVWHRFEPTVLGTPGESWRPCGPGEDDGGPAYGIALVSRLPVLRFGLVPLPAAPIRSPIVLPGPKPRVVLLEDEPRMAIVAVVEHDGVRVTIASTHLSFVPGWNVRQLRLIQRELADWPRPVVLAGDLNLPGALPATVTGWRRAVKAPTYPSTNPRVQLDHILVGHGRVDARGGVLPLAVSDHCAAYADLFG
ncbi:MAG: endonuclease/exonuclease/phosphatase family protein [Pseudonocardiales bacterium]|nr:endonuclease/exonuclease/phosphatase family protein [Pseudonocardiales bacterium]